MGMTKAELDTAVLEMATELLADVDEIVSAVHDLSLEVSAKVDHGNSTPMFDKIVVEGRTPEADPAASVESSGDDMIV